MTHPFYWLIELVDPATERSLALYVAKDVTRSIRDPWEAHRFASKEEAERYLHLAPKALVGEWRATEHGFINEKE